MKIAIDVMGGDFPEKSIEGAFLSAIALSDVDHIFVGDSKIIAEKIKSLTNTPPSNIHIEHVSQSIEMWENPIEVIRTKSDSSLVKCAEMVRDQKADAFISAGNTGAVVAISTFILKLLSGIKRAGIAVPIPTKKGLSVLIDAGANLDCRPLNYLQYGVMASLYSKYLNGNTTSIPSVGLLNIGEESNKGNRVTSYVHQLFKKFPVNFIGNIEGHEIFSGRCDVIVCEGFVGNILLKFGEGIANYILSEIINQFKGSEDVSKYLGKLSQKIDYSTYGGAPLLGLNGIVIICHGRSQPNAIANAIGVAAKLVKSKLNEDIIKEINKLGLLDRFQGWLRTKLNE